MRIGSRLMITVIMFMMTLAPVATRGAVLEHNQYPKLANIFFRWDITASEAQQLAKWDVLIIDMDVQTYTPDRLREIKKLNPNIKLIAYLASQEIRGDSGTLSGTLRQKLYNQIDPSWWLKDASGNRVSWWPGNPIVNVTSDAPTVNSQRWSDVLSGFIKKNLMDTGLWDGVFLDNAWDNLSFLQNKYSVDANCDKSAEPIA
ncbi:MAG: putative glycoside hydrolase, partial [Parcubacteria group bacterium]